MEVYKSSHHWELAEKISKEKPQLIVIAGETASGKTHLASDLEADLKLLGYDAKILSLDNFYVPNTEELGNAIGNFDHIFLIDKNELVEAIEDLLNTGSTYIPVYDFTTGHRAGKEQFEMPDDFLIVEGLYAIDYLSDVDADKLNIYVDAGEIEKIIRKVHRDIKRIGKSPSTLFRLMNGAVAMFNIYGKGQREDADIFVQSDYRIMEFLGDTSYQAKTIVEKEDLNEILEGMKAKKEIELKISDLYYKDSTEDMLRLRLAIDENDKVYTGISVKASVSGSGTGRKVWSYSFEDEDLYTAIAILAQLYDLKLIDCVEKYREVYSAKEVEIHVDRPLEGSERYVLEVASKDEQILRDTLQFLEKEYQLSFTDAPYRKISRVL